MKELDACIDRLDALLGSMGESRMRRLQGENASSVESWIASVEQVRSMLMDVRDRVREESLLARQDAVTGLANRRAFDELLDRCCRKGDRVATDATWTLSLIDIDHFKWVNDRWGHGVGDEVLRNVAQKLSHHCKVARVVARFGGEEFAVLFECSLADALVCLERFRADVADAVVGHGHGQRRITCSGGVAEREPNESIGGWMRRVDAALYCAKQYGRNRIVCRRGVSFWSEGESVAFLQRLADGETRDSPESLELRQLQRLDEVPSEDAPGLPRNREGNAS